MMPYARWRRLVGWALLMVGVFAWFVGLSGALREMHRLRQYRAWYADVERCAHVLGHFDSLTFGRLPPSTSLWGLWLAPHAILLDPEKRDDEWVVKHEMLHDLLQGGVHDFTPFGDCEWRP